MLLRLTTIVAIFLLWVPVAQAWSWPVQGPVLQAFSYDEAHPYAPGQHRGIDIGAPATGTPVVAPESGTVSFAGSVPTSGKSVTIETSGGYSVTLTHLGSIAVAPGASVAEGAVVGTVGPSGTPEVAGPYVHLGIRVTADANGYLDPLSLLPSPATPPPPDSSGSSSSAGSGSSSSSDSGSTATSGSSPAPAVPKQRVADGGGIVIRDRPSASPAARSGRGHQSGSAESSGNRSEARRPSRHERRSPTRTLQRPVVEPAPSLFRHPASPLPASATPPVRSRRRPAQQPLQLGLAAGPGVVAGLAAIATALVRLRGRRRRDGTAAVVRLLPPSGKRQTMRHAA